MWPRVPKGSAGPFDFRHREITHSRPSLSALAGILDRATVPSGDISLRNVNRSLLVENTGAGRSLMNSTLRGQPDLFTAQDASILFPLMGTVAIPVVSGMVDVSVPWHFDLNACLFNWPKADAAPCRIVSAARIWKFDCHSTSRPYLRPVIDLACLLFAFEQPS